MDVKIIDEQFDREIYNSQANHPLQAWEWGEARKKTGVDVLRLGEFDGDKLKHVFQITFHPIPHTPYKIGYLPRSIFPSQQVLDFLTVYGQQHKVIFFKIEPYEEKNALSNRTIEQSSNFVRSSHPLFPDWTMKLDLNPSEEELMANMKSKTRYNVRLAERKGVVVKEMSTDEGFEIFSKLYFETTKRQKYHGHTKTYHKIIWDSLKNGMAHILIAFFENEPLAAYELFFFHDTFYYPYGGSSEKYRNLMGANLLMWEAIRLGKKLGATSFDMWGSLPPNYDQSNPWAGFTRFKEGYNAQFTEMIGSFDLIVNSQLYRLYNMIYKVREAYLHR